MIIYGTCVLLGEAQESLRSATLDRVTYRGNARKNIQLSGNKCQSNSLECRRYHTLGKTSGSFVAQQQNRTALDALNGCLLEVDPLTKRSSNYSGLTVDSFFYRTNGTTSTRYRDQDRPKRPKSTERLFDVVDRNDCCPESCSEIYERAANATSRNGSSINDDKHQPRRSQDSKRPSEAAREPLYEIIALKIEPPKAEIREERRRQGRRPHSAPAIEAQRAEEQSTHKRCQHRTRKTAPIPVAFQDPEVAPLTKYRLPAAAPANVLEVENNNKIIVKLEPMETSLTNNVNSPSDESSPGAPPPNAKRLRCASVPVEQNKIVVPRSAVSLPCMPIRDGRDVNDIGSAVNPPSPPSSRPSSPATSTSSGNLTSECSGWVSSGDTSSSEQRRAAKVSGEQLRQKLSKIVPRKEKSSSKRDGHMEHSYEEVRLPPPKMFQDEPPPPEEFRDPAPAAQMLDNPLYHVYETVKRAKSPKQNKTAPCSPQRNRDRENVYAARDICLDCYQVGMTHDGSILRDINKFH